MERREIDAVGMVFGLLFVVLGVSVLTGVVDELARLDWLWPALLLVLGLAMILQASDWLGRRGRRAEGTDPAAAGMAPEAEQGAAPEAPTVPLEEREREGGRP